MTKEEVEEEKARLRAVDARPIKKVRAGMLAAGWYPSVNTHHQRPAHEALGG